MKSNGTTTTDFIVMNKQEYGKRWKICRDKVNGLIRDGLPVVRLGHRIVRIEVLEADAWIKSHYTQNGRAKNVEVTHA